MNDPYAPVPPGTEGTVDFIDDACGIHMQWDNGRSLALIPGEDLFLTTKNYRIKRQIFHKELPGTFPADKIKSVSPDSWQNQIKGETLFT